MRKMKLNQQALRRTASRTPVDNRIFKPAALARAIAGVFVSAALIGGHGQAWALETDEATFKLMRAGEGSGEVMPLLPSIPSGDPRITLNGLAFKEYKAIFDEDGSLIDQTNIVTSLTFAPTYRNTGFELQAFKFDIGGAYFTTNTSTQKYALPNLMDMTFIAGTEPIFIAQTVDFNNSRNGTIYFEGGSIDSASAFKTLDGGGIRITNSGNGTIVIKGSATSQACGITTLSSVSEKDSLSSTKDGVYNNGNGAIQILGGDFEGAAGIDIFSTAISKPIDESPRPRIVNEENATLIIQGGSVKSAVGMRNFSNHNYIKWSTNAELAHVVNFGTAIIQGGHGLNSYGIQSFATDGGKAEVGNVGDRYDSTYGDANMTISGGYGQGSAGIY